MEGGHDPDCRKTMPWEQIEAGEFAEHQHITRALINLRKTHPQLRGEKILWHHNEKHPRLVCYDRQNIRVYLNNTDEEIVLNAQPLFAYKYEKGKLLPGGVLITDFSGLQEFAGLI